MPGELWKPSLARCTVYSRSKRKMISIPGGALSGRPSSQGGQPSAAGFVMRQSFAPAFFLVLLGPNSTQ
jgi:hypothetical protein